MDDFEKELGIQEVSEEEALGIIEAEASKKEEPSMGQAKAGLIGAKQGLTFGLADELSGAIGAAGEKIGQSLGAFEPSEEEILSQLSPEARARVEKQKLKVSAPKSKEESLLELYRKYRDEQRAELAQAKELYPKTVMAGEFAGGMLLPAGVLGTGLKTARKFGQIIPKAPLKQLAKEGAKIGAIAGGLYGAGASEADLTKATEQPQVLGEFTGDVALGGTIGAGTGAALPGVAEYAGRQAKSIKQFFGDLAEPYIESFKLGAKGKGLATERGRRQFEKETKQAIEEMAPKLSSSSKELAAMKSKIIQDAEERGVKLDPNKVDEYFEKYLSTKTKSPAPEALKEQSQFQEILRTAKEGPMVRRVEQQKLPLVADESMQQLENKKQLVLAKKKAEGSAASADDFTYDFERIPDSDNMSVVLKQRVRTEDAPEKAMAQINELKNKHLAKSEASGQVIDPNDLEVVTKPLEDGSTVFTLRQKLPEGKDANKLMQRIDDKRELQIARQKAINEGIDPSDLQTKIVETSNPDEYAAVLIRKMTDEEGNEVLKPIKEVLIKPEEAGFKIIGQKIANPVGTTYKAVDSRIIEASDFEQKFKDITKRIRAGDKDPTLLSEFEALRDALAARSKMGKSAYGTKDVGYTTTKAAEEARDLIREAVPKVKDVDTQLFHMNKAAEALGFDSAREMSEEAIIKKFDDLVNNMGKESTTGRRTRDVIEDFFSNLAKADINLARKIRPKAMELAQQADIKEGVQRKIYLPRLLATAEAAGMWGANVAGSMSRGLTPEWARNSAEVVAKKGTPIAKRFSEELRKYAESGGRGRNAILFSIMQNPQYRQLLEEVAENMNPFALEGDEKEEVK